MKERPILFSAPMVLALLAGTKTQTRRIVKAAPGKQSEWLTSELLGQVKHWATHPVGVNDDGPGVELVHPKGGPLGYVTSPYGGAGDRLWVKETWAAGKGYDAEPKRRLIALKSTELPRSARLWYRADAKDDSRRGKWRPSIFMRRWMSRLVLEVTGLRVERLNEISESDAIAEGTPRVVQYRSAREAYSDLWESINGAGSWAANPLVWVVEFKRLEPKENARG